MLWRNVIATLPLETGPVHDAGVISTRSGCGSENVPFMRCPGSETVNAASAAVLITLAVVVVVYSCSTPGVNAPKLAAGPSVRLSVAGTVPDTSPLAGTPTEMPSVVLSTQTLPPWPVTLGALLSRKPAVAETLTEMVSGG